MKQSPRKWLALLLALCMLVPLFAVSAFAEDAEEALPLDYRFEAVPEEEVTVSAEAIRLGFDPFQSLQWDMKMIGMAEGWRYGLTGKGVTVGIVDSGLSRMTGDIETSRILEGVNLSPVHVSFLPVTADTVGHGTFISGIIGAARGNGVGISGMAPEVTFAPIKCFSALFSTPDAVISGMDVAVSDYHCDVINVSSGMPEQSASMLRAVRHAVDSGAILISTVGNDGDDTLNYPGAYDEVIAVGAVDKNMQVCDFSNKNESVFCVAPGEKVLSLGRVPMTVYRSDGTSFSAPFVAGLAAMLKQDFPQMNQNDFKEILKASCKDLGEPGYDTSYGWGLIDVPAAIRAADEYFGNTRVYPEALTVDPFAGSFVMQFMDALKSDWFFGAVKYCFERGLMMGRDAVTFAPMDSTTRAEFATVLYRLAGSPDVAAEIPFADCRGHWAEKAIAWAFANGVVNGMDADTFAPDQKVTREQLVTMLFRARRDAAAQGDLNAFADAGTVSDWAQSAMRWAVATGILTGRTATTLAPQGTANRAELATILMRIDQMK